MVDIAESCFLSHFHLPEQLEMTNSGSFAQKKTKPLEQNQKSTPNTRRKQAPTATFPHNDWRLLLDTGLLTKHVLLSSLSFFLCWNTAWPEVCWAVIWLNESQSTKLQWWRSRDQTLKQGHNKAGPTRRASSCQMILCSSGAYSQTYFLLNYHKPGHVTYVWNFQGPRCSEATGFF